ncbi:MAG: sigma-70 family RNA polymerase sigma factor [Oscillospiraceae bacterium]|nr:sigma-70 family RNA polymerase sigma factor [Oscillospiraceae bacterium]MDD7354999.1 sigma-70 family RNA polymerase sigma factor [Oscillospiraceae bacterium]MDY3938589.1 sigma-70 family RNA polymerase sigma factor [Oscillospiraceae bacterium]
MTLLEKTYRDSLINDNIGLVYSCANKFKNRGAEYEDLVQCGCVGLIKAADGFDPSLGYKFSTYAVPAILGEIKRVFRDGGAVKVGRSDREKSRNLMKVQELLFDKLGRSPTVSELANECGYDEARTAQLLCASMPVISLTPDDDSDFRPTDIASDENDEQMNDAIAVKNAVERLCERDRQIVDMRYFKGFTQSATAKALGMTQVQVSRREKTILKILRENLT